MKNIFSSEADSLLESLLGISGNSENSEEKLYNKQLNSKEYYQLPVKTGRQGFSIDDGDKPWIVGHFSPNKATDKNHLTGHRGLDLKAPHGTPVYPIASGKIIETGTGNKAGNYIKILHENGHVRSFYGHLDRIAISKGKQVDQNTIIGYVGETGNAKGRGAHLHFEVRINEQLVDPLGITGKLVGSLSRRANLINYITKIASELEKCLI